MFVNKCNFLLLSLKLNHFLVQQKLALVISAQETSTCSSPITELLEVKTGMVPTAAKVLPFTSIIVKVANKNYNPKSCLKQNISGTAGSRRMESM